MRMRPQLLDFAQNRDPVAPLLDALARAAKLPNVDPDVMSRPAAIVECRVERRSSRSTSRTLIHGDLTFENVLWDGDEVTALIDFEWARPAPRDLELDVLLRFCAYPFLHVADDYEAQTRRRPTKKCRRGWRRTIRSCSPRRTTRDRLRLYAIAFEVRQLLLLPPSAPAHVSCRPRDPLPRLVRLLTNRSYLDLAGLLSECWMETGAIAPVPPRSSPGISGVNRAATGLSANSTSLPAVTAGQQPGCLRQELREIEAGRRQLVVEAERAARRSPGGP